jgi:hypothetical protein
MILKKKRKVFQLYNNQRNEEKNKKTFLGLYENLEMCAFFNNRKFLKTKEECFRAFQ